MYLCFKDAGLGLEPAHIVVGRVLVVRHAFVHGPAFFVEATIGVFFDAVLSALAFRAYGRAFVLEAQEVFSLFTKDIFVRGAGFIFGDKRRTSAVLTRQVRLAEEPRRVALHAAFQIVLRRVAEPVDAECLFVAYPEHVVARFVFADDIDACAQARHAFFTFHFPVLAEFALAHDGSAQAGTQTCLGGLVGGTVFVRGTDFDFLRSFGFANSANAEQVCFA